jgi:hypothetical protein
LAAVAEKVSGVLTVSQPGDGRKPGKSAVVALASFAVPSESVTVVGGVITLRGLEMPGDEREGEPQAVTATTIATAAAVRFT